MKTRFNTFDIVCGVTELQKLIGMRVNNVYDIDNKTYLIRLQRTEEKAVLLLESGNRFHSTAFEWPKNVAPSGFSMKMRKHLKNKRLEKLTQLGTDRIIDMQFGTSEAAYHVILELYDRGNIILTDYELTILYVLRPHTEGEEVKFAVKEKYPVDRARIKNVPPKDEVKQILESAKQGDQLKKTLIPHLDYGPPLIEHALLEMGFTSYAKIGKDVNIENDLERIIQALQLAQSLMDSARMAPSKGYIIQKKEERPTTGSEKEFFFSNQEFHPHLFKQHSNLPHRVFDSFDATVDEFFSTLESQKIDMKAIQQEREAVKKLDNVKKDHDQRLQALEHTQEADKQKAELITRNQELVENAILAIQSALASQMSWPDIQLLVKEAQAKGDPIASSIKQLKLEMNHITLHLNDPYSTDEDNGDLLKPMLIDIDLALSAFANARRFYDQKRNAAKKQQKTIESQGKALKSAEKKTKQTLKEMQTITNINKARKVYWFEKFYWFISSENYLVIGGRDQQQNELIVKRYMRANDVYVHADIHGASSVVVKNPTDQPVPPKTLNEAGTMAICYSVAWEAKVVTSAWWVNASQVSKTAPTGEYLTTGSFMIRGKKNYLPPCHLVMGLSFLFKLEDGSIARHKDERRIRGAEEDADIKEDDKDEVELEVLDESDGSIHNDDSEDDKPRFPDTHIKIQHFEGTKINVLTEPNTPQIDDNDSDSEKVIFLGDDKPVILKPSGRSRGPSESKNKLQKTSAKETKRDDENKQQSQVKRGQKGKLKKIKEKYKDQDEEERRLRMEILQSSSKGKESKKSKKKEQQIMINNKRPPPRIRPPAAPKQDDAEDDDGAEEVQVAADVDMLDSLTGQPVAEDELLFAVPVVAPYNTVLNCKFKVKLTPGTGKRGKASRTAVSMFLRDRTTTQREKDLLRSVKDETLARNLPGKVKVSAPKLQALRK
ncbi:Caliban [Carabus blaptoides fortunei]